MTDSREQAGTPDAREVISAHARRVAEAHEGQGPVDATDVFRPPPSITPQQGIMLGGAAALLFGYPALARIVITAIGVRGTALAAVLLIAFTRGFARNWVRTEWDPSFLERAAVLGLFLTAAATDQPAFLAAVPAVVSAMLARIFFASINQERSLIERAANVLQPLVPDFIGPYCRKVTGLWGALFASNAVVIVVLIVFGSTASWQQWTLWGMYIPFAVVTIVEFFVRKIWFRHYEDKGIDRIFARVFPAENTAQGRRSQAYIAQMRSEIAAAARHTSARNAANAGVGDEAGTSAQP